MMKPSAVGTFWITYFLMAGLVSLAIVKVAC